jgi:asparagine synthase (glutamine-hydrolysing)
VDGATAIMQYDRFGSVFPPTAIVAGGSEHAIVCDARLLYQKDLHVRLGLASSKEITDDRLLLAAYNKWGRDCVTRLEGDFSFAIWDGDSRDIVLHRDMLGAKPLYYVCKRGVVAFASDLRELLPVLDVRAINDTRIVDHLAGIYVDEWATFYSDVYRLAPGWTLVIKDGKVLARLHATHLPEAVNLTGRSDDDVIDGFRHTFLAAIRARLDTSVVNGSFLSGGLDSSVVTTAVRQCLPDSLPLKTISAVFDSLPQCDERKYIEDVLAVGEYEAHLHDGTRHDPINTWKEVVQQFGVPVTAPGISQSWLRMKHARDAGVEAAFDGHGGDEVISHGIKYLEELAHNGHWARLVYELSRIPDTNTAVALLFYVHEVTRESRPFLAKVVGRLGRYATSGTTSGAPRFTLLRREKADEVGLGNRYEQYRELFGRNAASENEQHRSILTAPSQSYALEVITSMAERFGIEVLMPFWDVRLVAYTQAIPGHLKLRRGLNRYILRRAMWNELPSSVRLRKDKTNFTDNIALGVRHADKAQMYELLEAPNLSEYVDVSAVVDMLKCLNGGTITGRESASIQHVLSLATWLQAEDMGSRAWKAREARWRREEVSVPNAFS